MKAAPIYGYEFTRPFEAAGLTFTPVEHHHPTAHRLARDLSRHHLMGTVSGATLDREDCFKLSAVLSFIEHLDVVVGDPLDDADADTLKFPERHFPLALSAKPRHNGGGAVIASDVVFRESRPQFIGLMLAAVNDTSPQPGKGRALLLYKSAETFRQRQPFMEITYFLLVSALESYCRHVENDFTSRNAAEPMVRALRKLGFDVEQDNPARPRRSITNYLHLRNALFHRGRFEHAVNVNGSTIVLKCADYLFQLSMLVSLTLLKAVGFDDQHTNWDAWIDRHLLK